MNADKKMNCFRLQCRPVVSRRLGGLRICAYLCSSVVLFSVGCAGGGDFENENDRLRAVNLELQRERDELETKLDLRMAELEAARQQLSADAPPVEGAQPPQLAKIAFDRYSGAVDTDGDGIDDRIRVYIRPLDGQGRFLPVSGKATVRLVTIPETDSPDVLAERTFEPGEWDDAYRSGFMGTHYTLELELPQPPLEGLTQATLHVTLTQGSTGVKLTQQQVIPIAQ